MLDIKSITWWFLDFQIDLVRIESELNPDRVGGRGWYHWLENLSQDLANQAGTTFLVCIPHTPFSWRILFAYYPGIRGFVPCTLTTSCKYLDHFFLSQRHKNSAFLAYFLFRVSDKDSLWSKLSYAWRNWSTQSELLMHELIAKTKQICK